MIGKGELNFPRSTFLCLIQRDGIDRNTGDDQCEIIGEGLCFEDKSFIQASEALNRNHVLSPLLGQQLP